MLMSQAYDSIILSRLIVNIGFWRVCAPEGGRVGPQLLPPEAAYDRSGRANRVQGYYPFLLTIDQEGAPAPSSRCALTRFAGLPRLHRSASLRGKIIKPAL